MVTVVVVEVVKVVVVEVVKVVVVEVVCGSRSGYGFGQGIHCGCGLWLWLQLLCGYQHLGCSSHILTPHLFTGSRGA